MSNGIVRLNLCMIDDSEQDKILAVGKRYVTALRGAILNAERKSGGREPSPAEQDSGW